MSPRAWVLAASLFVSAAAPAAAATPPALAIAAAEDLARDSEDAAAMATHGRLLYDADANKRSWGAYCADARRLADAGEFRLAIRQASKALFLGEKQGSANARAFAMRDLAYAYAFTGRLDLAEGWARQALVAAKKAGGNVDISNEIVAPTHKVLGDVAARRGRYDEALGEYQAALDAAGFFSSQIAEIRIAIAAAQLRRGDAGDALQSFASETGAGEGLGATARRGMGEAALALGRHDDARAILRKAVDEARAAKDPYGELWAHYDLARVAIATGSAGAAEALDAAIALAESLRGAFRVVEFKSGLFGEVQDVFDLAIEQAASAGDASRALALSERSRARAALDMLRERTRAGRDGGALTPVTPDEARKALPGKTVIVAYHALASSTLAWTVRSGGIEMKRLAWGRGEIEKRVASTSRHMLALSPEASQDLRGLFDALVGPLGIAPGETVVFIPHHALHLAPLHAAGTEASPLILTNPVAYALSLSTFVETLRKPLATSGPLLALGNPDLGDSRLDLPAAEEEVKAIAAIAKAPAVFVRADASAERFRAGTRGAGIVHVAAHATVDDVDAIRSTLHLSGGDIEAREVYDLDLRSASLVALSACSSGVGRVSRGDEFWGFKRSFLVAGARSLVVSLWPVADEATGQLMVSFYRERERSGAAEALRQAQLATRRDHPHPLFWAPFIVVGDWR